MVIVTTIHHIPGEGHPRSRVKLMRIVHALVIIVINTVELVIKLSQMELVQNHQVLVVHVHQAFVRTQTRIKGHHIVETMVLANNVLRKRINQYPQHVNQKRNTQKGVLCGQLGEMVHLHRQKMTKQLPSLLIIHLWVVYGTENI